MAKIQLSYCLDMQSDTTKYNPLALQHLNLSTQKHINLEIGLSY